MKHYIYGRRIKIDRLFVLIICLVMGIVFVKKISSMLGGTVSVHDDKQNSLSHEKPNKHPERAHIEGKQKSHNENYELVNVKDPRKRNHKCLNYEQYAKVGHKPLSEGPYRYPFMRPEPQCRTFTSLALEIIIDDLKGKIKDPDLARLIENCLPNTLDTTIAWHKSSLRDKSVHFPQTFVVTGDIHAEWLRDSARQLSVYQPFLRFDDSLKELIKGAINTQAFYIINSPYCNAFHAPPGSSVKKGKGARDSVFPRPDWSQVFECKYELDSLASFLTLTNEYFENSDGDLSFLNDLWLKAFEKLLIVVKRESEPTFDEDTGSANVFYYSFQRQTNIGTETLPLGGVGNPVNYGTGLVRSAFRPSDDACTLQFFIPANCHLVTELKRIRDNFLNSSSLKSPNADLLISYTDHFIEQITNGIEKYGIVNHPKWGRVYAYEVDGYGSNIFMDDANIPSLLSLPDMKYVDVNDEVYQNTRKMILSKEGNPYYLKGPFFEGIGGPHIGISNAWPMSLLMRMRTTDDDDEILQNLKMVMKNTAGLGIMHESVHVNSRNGAQYTRPWFAWCNSEFGKTILHLAKSKPHLIFKEEFAEEPYVLENILKIH